MNTLIKRSLIILPTIALAGLVASGMAMADSKGDHDGWGEIGGKSYSNMGAKGAKKMLRYMDKALDLTDAQEDAIKDIMKDQHEGMSGGHQAMAAHFSELAQLKSGSNAYIAKAKVIGALQGEAMGQRLIDRANTEAQISDVLTPEQVKKYQVMHGEMTEKRAERMEKHTKKDDHSD
jgi:Spy/CpxP family protein refolding chaperone